MVKVRKGFTLVEVIVASIILCAAVLALGAISTRAVTATRLNRQYETAIALADKQLTMIDYMGIDEFIKLGRNQGKFPGPEPEYRWEVTTQSQEINNLYRVKVTVSWVERNQPYSVAIDTVLNGQGAITGGGLEAK